MGEAKKKLKELSPITEPMTLEEAAEFLRLTPLALYKKAYRREIPSIKKKKFIRFDKQQLIDWLAEGQREGS